MALMEGDRLEKIRNNRFATFFLVTFVFVLSKQVGAFLFGGEYSLLLDIVTSSIIVGFLVFVVFRKRFDA
jgi:uncharacterized membrane protein YccC